MDTDNVEMKNDDAGGRDFVSIQTDPLELTWSDQLMIGKALQESDVLELYSPMRVNAVAVKFGLVPGMILDLPNG